MIKNILIKGELEGRGIVNFDGSEQRWTLTKHGIVNGKLEDNVKLGKKAFIKTGEKKEDGTEIYDYKIKIAADCLRHAIFGNDVDVVNGTLTYNPFILATYSLSPIGLMRGYMFANRGDNTVKRKSPLSITDAIQCNNAKSEIEVGSTTGGRTSTSYFFNEKVGDIKYSYKGQISIKDLQFISADPFFDRLAIYSDIIDSGEAKIIMDTHYGKDASFDTGLFSSMGKYTSASYGENGILLSDEICEKIIKQTLKNILAINITKNTAYASTSSLKIKLVENILGEGQGMEDDENWIELKTEKDIDGLNLKNLHHFYEKASDEEVEKAKEYHAKYEADVNSAKEEKEKEKSAKKAKKNATVKTEE